MPKVSITCDQNFLKNVSAIERVLLEHGRFHPDEAERIANLCAGHEPVSIHIENPEHANEIAANLKKIMDVDATVEP